MSRPHVKICCIASIAEMELAVRAGASAVGLVSEMPSGPGVIPEALIAEIAAAAPPGLGTFLLTCRQEADGIAEQARRTGVNTVQLCDSLPATEYARLRARLPGARLVQVIHVTGPTSLDEAREAANYVDALLLDSGNPSLAVKELGGTGRQHDWSISRQIVETVPGPVYLAGGLKPGNVQEAVRRVRPYGLDICSGLRSGGALDGAKVAAFFQALEGALAA